MPCSFVLYFFPFLLLFHLENACWVEIFQDLFRSNSILCFFVLQYFGKYWIVVDVSLTILRLLAVFLRLFQLFPIVYIVKVDTCQNQPFATCDHLIAGLQVVDHAHSCDWSIGPLILNSRIGI